MVLALGCCHGPESKKQVGLRYDARDAVLRDCATCDGFFDSYIQTRRRLECARATGLRRARVLACNIRTPWDSAWYAAHCILFLFPGRWPFTCQSSLSQACRPSGKPVCTAVLAMYSIKSSFQLRLFLTHPHSAHPAQLPIQTTLILLRHRWPVGICLRHGEDQRTDAAQEAQPHDRGAAGGHMVVLVQREDAQNVVVLVDRLAPIPPLLLVGPVAVGVAVLALDARRVDVAAVLLGMSAVVLAYAMSISRAISPAMFYVSIGVPGWATHHFGI